MIFPSASSLTRGATASPSVSSSTTLVSLLFSDGVAGVGDPATEETFTPSVSESPFSLLPKNIPLLL